MADVVAHCMESAVNQYEHWSGKDDMHCVKCALMNAKLQSMSQEMKSMQLVIDILQEKINLVEEGLQAGCYIR
jgi:alpha-D-ribose 1-methylphosphonate 5-triphosphate synthase subunit PhnG